MARQTLKPPFAYYGGKTTLAPQIAKLLPEHDHYVEPFAGSLAVLLAKEPSPMETVNDLDSRLVAFWRVLRESPEELQRLAKLTPHSREEYKECSQLDADTDTKLAWQAWVTITQGRRPVLDDTGWKSRIKASSGSMSDTIFKYAERFEPVAARLSNVSIENRDALCLIDSYGEEPTVCIYADPPYLGSTRGGRYGSEMLEDDLHVQLAESLRKCRASVVLSGYASPLYEELYEGWHRYELKAPTRLSGTAAPNEILWSNVPLGDQTSLF